MELNPPVIQVSAPDEGTTEMDTVQDEGTATPPPAAVQSNIPFANGAQEGSITPQDDGQGETMYVEPLDDEQHDRHQTVSTVEWKGFEEWGNEKGSGSRNWFIIGLFYFPLGFGFFWGFDFCCGFAGHWIGVFVYVCFWGVWLGIPATLFLLYGSLWALCHLLGTLGNERFSCLCKNAHILNYKRYLGCRFPQSASKGPS
jgi:hypothetical protein